MVFVSTAEWNKQLQDCEHTFAFWGVLTTAVIDLIIGVMSLGLFVNKLKLIVMVCSVNANSGCSPILIVLKRSAALGTVAILSSEIVLVITAIGLGAEFGVVDIVVNAVCLLLIFSDNIRVYECLCCGFVWLCDSVYRVGPPKLNMPDLVQVQSDTEKLEESQDI